MAALRAEKAKQEAALHGEAPAPTPAPAPKVAVAPSATGTYTYDQLVAGPIDGVDSARKQDYLNDADFAEVFKMTKAEFEALPKWKQQAQKKNAGLF